MSLSAAEFVAELDRENHLALQRIESASAAGEAPSELTIPRLLMLALKNELEATECAALWIPTTDHVRAKLGFARQAGDEARHYALIQKRLEELGTDTKTHDPFAQGRSPLLTFLASLTGRVERVAAGQFTREALGVVRNEQFMRFAEAMGDAGTARLYRDIIQPDETHHHELGRSLLLELATSDDAQQKARDASRKTLAMAEELQEIARLKLGISRAPGC